MLDFVLLLDLLFRGLVASFVAFIFGGGYLLLFSVCMFVLGCLLFRLCYLGWYLLRLGCLLQWFGLGLLLLIILLRVGILGLSCVG